MCILLILMILIQNSYNHVTDYGDFLDLDDLPVRNAGIAGLRTETASVVQKSENPALVNNLQLTVDKLAAVLLKRTVSGEDAMVITTPKLTMTVAKNTASAMLGKKRKEGHGSYDLPQWCKLKPTTFANCSDDEVISLQVNTF